ncbi:response regulator [Mucilaginibacter sp. L196]|uniref:response regulator n=1 Tax=Mucilaginibacter sp. L196 TaxID=1641870 RepID=UPI001C207188|nr:response regulator [Mucilaginibacter sp. L196]
MVSLFIKGESLYIAIFYDSQHHGRGQVAALKAGMDYFLSKPVSFNQFLLELKKAFMTTIQ